MNACGGCNGETTHSPRCRTQPGWMWRRFADRAEALADDIGSNDLAAANQLYRLTSHFNALAKAARPEETK